MRINAAIAISSMCLACLAWGCQPTHVVYVHNATLGIDASVSNEGVGQFVIGYDRQTYAIVPRFTPPDHPEAAEAMSLASVSNVKVQGLDRILFNHFVVTGQAANAAAEDPDALKIMRRAVFGDEGKENK